MFLLLFLMSKIYLFAVQTLIYFIVQFFLPIVCALVLSMEPAMPVDRQELQPRGKSYR
jgi:hypothetical protein